MAFRQLIDGECGNSNSLVQLSTVLTRDGTLNSRVENNASAADLFVHEFSQHQSLPQTFQMNALLNSIQDIPGSSQGHSWGKEYAQFNMNPTGDTLQSNYRWNNSTMHVPRPMMTTNFPSRSNFYQRPNLQIQYLDQDENVGIQHSQLPSENVDVESLTKEASKKILDVTKGDDTDLAYSQFMSFMKQVSGEDVLIDLQNESGKHKGQSSQDEQLEKLAETYKEEWDKLSNMNDISWSPHLSEKTNPFQEYGFAENNAMLVNRDALTIGKEKLKMGDIPGAVLCFEAAVKQQPGRSEAWLLLGSSQAENEQDPQAIAALNKCIQLTPSCLEAYMMLGASFTNENYSYLAYDALLSWLKANPKYADLVPIDVNYEAMDSIRFSEQVLNLYIKAAQMNPMNVDADVQSALGVIFNIRQEYEKAIDCFKTALQVKSEDSHLWNRLGATLANGERSEEAVEAYQRALALEPGFIRARYNVGITCMNLGAYREAAEHFLVALNQQDKAHGVDDVTSGSKVVSSTIWSTLRMVCAFMDRHDITHHIDNRDLEALNKEFGV